MRVSQDVNPLGMFAEDLVEVIKEGVDLTQRVLETLPVVELVDDVHFCSWVVLDASSMSFKYLRNKQRKTHNFDPFGDDLHASSI